MKAELFIVIGIAIVCYAAISYLFIYVFLIKPRRDVMKQAGLRRMSDKYVVDLPKKVRR